jgi:hypothetical protein
MGVVRSDQGDRSNCSHRCFTVPNLCLVCTRSTKTQVPEIIFTPCALSDV